MRAGMIISLYKYVKLCMGGQGGMMGNVQGWDVTECGFLCEFKNFLYFFYCLVNI